MNIKIFIDNRQQDLTIKSRKHAIIFESKTDMDMYDVRLYFTKEQMSQITGYLLQECNNCWDNFTPKEATSEGTDYYEYYDRAFDNNGYLQILDSGLFFERPINNQNKLYQLNKAKAQSFVYDLLRHQGKEDI